MAGAASSNGAADAVGAAGADGVQGILAALGALGAAEPDDVEQLEAQQRELLAQKKTIGKQIKQKKQRDDRLMKKAVKHLSDDQLVRVMALKAAASAKAKAKAAAKSKAKAKAKAKGKAAAAGPGDGVGGGAPALAPPEMEEGAAADAVDPGDVAEHSDGGAGGD